MDYTVYVHDFPLEGETIIGKTRFVQPGGKGQNQAVAVAKSNLVTTTFIGSIGRDSDGKIMKSIHKEYGIISHLKESNESTGNATIIVNNESENKIIVVGGANDYLMPEDIDIRLLKECDYVILQNEIPNKTNEFVINEAYRLGKIIIYNAAPYRPINEEILSKVTYFIVNESELIKISKQNDFDSGVVSLLNKGVKNVLVTLGKKGSILISSNSKISVPIFPADAVDTVGAGDTYVGYFVASLAAGKTAQEAMVVASKASSITVSRKGSVISIPFGKEVY